MATTGDGDLSRPSAERGKGDEAGARSASERREEGQTPTKKKWRRVFLWGLKRGETRGKRIPGVSNEKGEKKKGAGNRKKRGTTRVAPFPP